MILSYRSLLLRIRQLPVGLPGFRPCRHWRFTILLPFFCLLFIAYRASTKQGWLMLELQSSQSRQNNWDWLTLSRYTTNEQVARATLDSKKESVVLTVNERVKPLPEVIRIPFEEAVSDVELQGWEDAWFSSATFEVDKHGYMAEPKIDFVYSWVNGSDLAFRDIKHKYEILSPLNDADGKWIARHGVNRYRDWDELKFSFRSLDKYARNFTNKIQLLVNSVETKASSLDFHPQRPHWLQENEATRHNVEVLAQENFFSESVKDCLPTFDSLSMESQIYSTPSSVDQLVALSDDMFLGVPHSAADFYSPLFGTVISFKQDQYNVKNIHKGDMPTFGEKPYLYYTSWLLNNRFGERERKVQAHFMHSISRKLLKEAMSSFPGPSMRGSCEKFRGESKYQIYPWYVAYHYSIERFREALLWSYIMTRSDANSDGYLEWTERQVLLEKIMTGKRLSNIEGSIKGQAAGRRDRIYYQMPAMQRQAGLEPPRSNMDVIWTSLDGPETIRNVKCNTFNVNKCFAEGFDAPISDDSFQNPDFGAANIFAQLTKREPKCGDCVIKFMLSNVTRGLEPLLPPISRPYERKIIIKALLKYQHTIVEPDAIFVMVKDAEQARNELIERKLRRKRRASQWCLNDDVMTEDARAIAEVKDVLDTVFTTMFPIKGPWET